MACLDFHLCLKLTREGLHDAVPEASAGSPRRWLALLDAGAIIGNGEHPTSSVGVVADNDTRESRGHRREGMLEGVDDKLGHDQPEAHGMA